MKNRIEHDSLYRALLKITIIPIVLLALLITAISVNSYANSINQEAQKGLKDLCSTILMMYDELYPGDYRVEEEDGATYLMKGEHRISDDFSIIDQIKENTDVDITLFCQDVRFLTTIIDDENSRVIGTKANEDVVEDVLEGSKEAFYSSILVDNKKYYAYYAPLINSDGSCFGMIFVGKTSAYVGGLIQRAVMPIIFVAIVAIIVTGLCTMSFSKHLVSAIRKTEDFLEKVTGGNLHAKLDPNVLKRSDELGEMGKHAIRMQKALRELVEQDILTGIYNRRSGEKMLRQVQEEYVASGIPFCVVLGDIDHFKYVNDTFGHECGDVVLTSLATRLKKFMNKKGFAARWGGEEFLLVFQGYHMDGAMKCMEELQEDIRSAKIIYQKEQVQLTMTFGIMEGSEEKINHIIKDADKKLYYGKNHGRNQIVFKEPKE